MSEPVGRPPLINDAVLQKLESVFAIGGTDKEACFYADISPATLYNYQNEHPEFVERKEALKEQPILKARQTVVKALDQPTNAQWYLTRKAKIEFAERIEKTGAGGEPLAPDTEAVRELTKTLNEIHRSGGITGNGGITRPVDTQAQD